jgi:hypothetical protein
VDFETVITFQTLCDDLEIFDFHSNMGSKAPLKRVGFLIAPVFQHNV